MKQIVKAPVTQQIQQGFTLIELMVTVAIIAILASIAYPSYTSYMISARRASAQTHLMDIAQRQQQYLLDARSYATNLSTLNVTTPSDVLAFYTIAVTPVVGPPPGFTATATPKSATAQAADVTLQIDHTGLKTPTNKW